MEHIANNLTAYKADLVENIGLLEIQNALSGLLGPDLSRCWTAACFAGSVPYDVQTACLVDFINGQVEEVRLKFVNVLHTYGQLSDCLEKAKKGKLQGY